MGKPDDPPEPPLPPWLRALTVLVGLGIIVSQVVVHVVQHRPPSPLLVAIGAVAAALVSKDKLDRFLPGGKS